MRRRRKGGFTLMEVVVALVLSSFIVLVARSMLDTMSDAARHVAASAGRHDAQANAERLLRTLAAASHLPRGDSVAFVGTARFAEFRSWCASAGGWRERCKVSLLVTTATETTAIALVFPRTSESFVVRLAASTASLCYLKSAANGGEWLPVWSESRASPLAIGMVVDGDTTIVRMGDSG